MTSAVLEPAQAPSVLSWRERLLARLARVSSTGRFIPELDGLRFVAIGMVYLFHVYGQMYVAAGARYDRPGALDPVAFLFCIGGTGVQLFFIISGFILGLPFAEQYLSGGRRISLKSYFLRRVTRLEPPYILSVIVALAATMIVTHQGLATLWPRVTAMFCYAHELTFGEHSRLNPVTWSLEIEVQFYITAPLLAYVFCIRRPALRRAMLLLGWIASAAAGQFVPPSLYPGFLQYFLMGFLLADLYVTQWKAPPAHGWMGDLLALLAFAGWQGAERLSRPWNCVFLAPDLFLLCVGVFRGRIARAILRNPWLSTTGGMCYTIYLYHALLIHAVHPLTGRLVVTRIFWVNSLIQIVLMTVVVLPICSLMFAWTEKPFMYKQWPAQFRAWLGRRFSSRERVEPPAAG